MLFFNKLDYFTVTKYTKGCHCTYYISFYFIQLSYHWSYQITRVRYILLQNYGTPKFTATLFFAKAQAFHIWFIRLDLQSLCMGESSKSATPPPTLYGPLDASAANRHLHKRLATLHLVIGIRM